jgi:flagellin
MAADAAAGRQGRQPDTFMEEWIMAAFSVVNNVASVNAQANLQTSNLGLTKSLNRLSSGLKINYSGDDAAGLAVANAYRSDVANLTQGIQNANDGLSTLQIADGALNNISTLLDRLATLASQSASSNFKGDRTTMDAEYQSVIGEITREAGVAGLSGAGIAFSEFVGTDNLTGTNAGADAAGLGLTGDITSATNAAAAVANVKSAVTTLGGVQGSVGTLENTMQYAISLAQSQVVNTTAAESRIRDANVAQESANMTRYNVLTQSGIAALAQANQSTASVLTLLR